MADVNIEIKQAFFPSCSRVRLHLLNFYVVNISRQLNFIENRNRFRARPFEPILEKG